MKKRYSIILLIALSGQIAFGQSFGKNKVQYRQFDWEFIKSPHFDVYFYGDDETLARFTSQVAEEAYEQVSKHLRWNLRKPVSIIVYNSHNDFQQTNVTFSYMGEGIGGVTELFKNRVVIPFEGSYEQFRHVIHHELVHAVVNDMVYGGSVQSIVSGAQRLSLPLWVNEGIAEYLSANWDTRADMILRDLSINDYIPHVKELDYYMAYKGGQSVWRFIAQKYGREKVGEIYVSMKKSQNAERGYEKALGMDFDDLTEQWHKYLKKEYWPDVADRDAVEDIATRLTDHSEKNNYYNISPAISPDGSKIAILSDRSLYADIYLIDAFNGKEIKRLIKGNRSIDFEELKWLQPGISWSPDGKHIVIAAKAGDRDVFHIVNVENGNREKISFDLDGLFTANWSPDGERLVFVGNQGSSSDIYLYGLGSGELVNLTDDIFSDAEPVWSKDGAKIAFVSDRGDYYNEIENNTDDTSTGSEDINMADLRYSQTDIFMIDLQSGKISQVTKTDYNENYPIFLNTENKLIYTADDQGIWNIFIHDLESNVAYPVTNIQTGIQQLSISDDDEVLVFSGFSKRGWDIYTITSPLKKERKTVEPTKYITSSESEDDSFTDLRLDKKREKLQDDRAVGDYSQVIFLEQYERYNTILKDNEEFAGFTGEPDSSRTNEEYISEPYKPRFTLDLVSGNVSISNVFGAQGMTFFAWSDILGDHQIYLGTEMQLSLENTDYIISYAYLKQRSDYYINLFQTADFFRIGGFHIGRLRHYGVSGFVSRPLSKYHRFDVGLSFHRVNYQIWFDNPYAREPQVVSNNGLTAVLPGVN
ncbi:MAG: hypothetical protein V3U16_07855, partial [Candidatus Neomarinimicrobiota bacterium]